MSYNRCFNCDSLANKSTKFCPKCNYYLFAEIDKKKENKSLYIPTFQTDLFGIFLFNQKQYENEIFSATRWVYLFVPLFPLTKITFKIRKIETIASQMHLFKLDIYESHLPNFIEVIIVYLRVIIGLTPSLLLVKYGDIVKNLFGLWITVILFISAAIFFIYVLIKLQNDNIDYEKYER